MKVSELFNNEFDEVKELEIFNILPNSHKIKFEESDLDEMVAMFEANKGTDQPNVKLSHSEQQKILTELFDIKDVPHGEELPNLGYLENVRRKGKSLVADVKRIPKVLKEVLFDGKLFKSISPEVVFNYKDSGKKFIKAISLTNNPSLKHIADVHMSTALNYNGNIIIEEVITMSDTTVKQEPIATAETVKMSDFVEMKTAMEKQINDLSLKLIEKDQNEKNFSEELSVLKENSRKEIAESICKTAFLEGVPKPVIDHFRPLLFSDAGESVIKFSEVIDGKTIEGQKNVTEIVKDFFKIYPNKVDFAERTKTSMSAPSDDNYKKVSKRKEELMAAGMSEFEALKKAGLENII
jgi:uncharacterized protein YoaH (UPF0181 family)